MAGVKLLRRDSWLGVDKLGIDDAVEWERMDGPFERNTIEMLLDFGCGINELGRLKRTY